MSEYRGIWRRIQSELRIKAAKEVASINCSPSFKSYVDLSHLDASRSESSSQGPNACVEHLSTDNLSICGKEMYRKSVDKSGNCGNTLLDEKDGNYNTKEGVDSNAKTLERNSNLLCGYLNKMKLGSRSLGKIFKRRWFVMADETCTLLYYSTPRDQVPLGQIEISRAVIIFGLEFDLNVFEVRTPEKSILLQADDHQTMMYWIQNLQKQRKKFFLLKDFRLDDDDEKSLVNSSEFQSILQKVDRPVKTVGESAAVTADLSRNKSFRDISLSKLRTEFQNKFSRLKSIPSSNTSGKNESPQELISPLQNSSKILKPNENSSDTEVNQDLPVQGNRGAKIIETFKGKFSRSFDLQGFNATNQDGKRNAPLKPKDSTSDCSECLKLQNIIDEMKSYKNILLDELMATLVRCKNLQKSSEKLSRELNNWKNLMSRAPEQKINTAVDAHDTCLREVTRREEKIVDLEDFIFTVQSELGTRDGLVRSLKLKLESAEDEAQNLKDNLKLKDEMLNFLSDKCFQLAASSECNHLSSESDLNPSKDDSFSQFNEVTKNRNSQMVPQKDPPENSCSEPLNYPTVGQSDKSEDADASLKSSKKMVDQDGRQGYIKDLWGTSNDLLLSRLDVIGCNIFDSKSTNLTDLMTCCNAVSDVSIRGDAHTSKKVGSGRSSSVEVKNGSESGSWIMVANEMKSHDHKEDEKTAYKTQNQMLNQEILDLNELLLLNEERLDQSQIRITQLEAMCYQLQGRHLKSLEEMLHLCSLDENPCELLRRIRHSIEVDLSKDSSTDGKLYRNILEGSKQAYDQYGFDMSQQCLPSKADINDAQHKPNPLKSRSDLTLSLKWDTMLISLERGTSKKSAELKIMIREGVPSQFRSRLWKICIDFLLQDYRTNSIVKSYSSLLDMINNKIIVTPSANQIELDLLRTLPNNKHFSTLSSPKIISLRNILLAFSIHNPEIGYCQGLNRLAAILLLFLNEEESFWGLVAIVEVIMPPKYYSHTLVAAHADQRVLKEFVSEKLPALVSHFSELSFELSLFTFSWFLTVFVDNMPINTFLRIWDTFLYEGSKVLFRYSVAIMKYYEEKMLSHCTAAEMNMFVRNMCEGLHDIDRLSQIAFNELNPFSMKKVRNKRNIHLLKLKQELQELDKLRHSFENSFSQQQQPHKSLEFKASNASNVSSDDND